MPSIAVDSNDDLHISYHDDTNDAIKYAWCSSSCTTASSWSNTTLANGSSFGNALMTPGNNPDFEFDSDGHMHIMHVDWKYHQLLYSTCSSSCSNNSSWSHSVLRSDVLYEVSLVIDSNDEFNIVFYDPYVDDLEFMLLDSSSQIYGYSISPDLPNWLSIHPTTGTISGTPRELLTNTTFTITVSNSGGTNTTTITIEVLDQLPGLSYSPDDLTLTKNLTSSDLPLSPTLTGSGAITSWAISPTLPSGLSFGTSNGTIWGTPTSLMTLKTFTIWANNSGGSSSATVNITVNDEAPDISYSPDWFVLTNNTAMSPTATPTNSGGAVPSTVIDSIGDIGEFSSIAIDSYGFKHISYFDATNIDIKYATDKTGSWVTISIDTSGNVGSSTSIAIDSNDAVHISYYDATNTGLKYATCSSGCTTTSNWNIVSVDTTGNVGWWTSIAVNSNNAVHISYYDSTNDDLKYATCASSCSSTSSWSKVTVDSSGDVGKYSSVAIDSNDAVHISYRDSTNDDLKYATCSSSCSSASSWTTSTIDSVGNVGSRTSIAIDSNDALHISYHDITNGDLKYATDQSGSWANTTVDSVGTVGQYTSIAIDSNDVVHISYYDATNKDLKYATNMQSSIVSGVGGVIKFVDRDAEVGRYSSIAVDSSGDVHISYYGATNGDLKYATLEGVHPWNVYAYSISPSLPAGLEINMNTGEISGTPRELLTNTTFTITVRNTGGTNTTTITIEVLDQLPGLSYSPENLTLTINNQSSDLPLNATVTGSGAITSWAISPSLPSGLNFGTSNGTIWGIPTVLQTTAVTYTIWANNSGGSVNATVNITVNDEAPDISYNPDWFVLTRFVDMSPTAVPTNAGGEIPSTIIQSSGVGYQTVSMAIDSNGYLHISYYDETNKNLMYATNEGGSWSTKTVDSRDDVGVASSIAVDSNDNVHIVYTVSSWTLPGFGYSDVLSYATCSSSCATSSWTKTDIARGYSGYGWDHKQFDLAIDSDDNLHFVFIKDYDDLMYVTCSSSCSSSNNNQYHSSWSIETIDAGDSFAPSIAIDSNDRLHISYSGDSTKNLKYATCYSSCSTSSSSWTITTVEAGNYSSGSSNYHEMRMSSIGIDSNGVKHIAYHNYTRSPGSGSSTYSHYYAVKYAKCSSSCTSASSWTNATIDDKAYSIDLEIDSNDNIHIFYRDGGNKWNHSKCSSSCLSNSSWSSTQVDVPATQFDKYSMAIDLQGNVHVANTNYNLKQLRYYTISSSGVFHNFSISPDLPSGMKIDGLTGEISGRPNVLMNNTTFTITVSNSGGVNTTTITIEVIDQVPVIAYSPQNLTLTKNQNSTNLPLTPTKTGSGTIVSWEINGTLPSGISFGSGNGTLWGVPTELWNTTSYMVWGNNSGGTAIAYLNITVIDQLPTISYSPADLILTNNTNSTDCH